MEESTDSYQAQVILPNLLRLLSLKKGEAVLDVACGQGFFTREFAKTGATVTGADISPELVKRAKERGPEISFHVAAAEKLHFAKDKNFDTVTIILALQNMADLGAPMAEAARVLKPRGRLVLVLNHPAFRIPKHSSWEFDEANKVQYRRLDRYLSAEKVAITMHPGTRQSAETISYHHSLQDFFKALTKNNFAITRLEEWISHKQSGKGPRQKSEDLARKEFPLFLLLEARLAEAHQR